MTHSIPVLREAVRFYLRRSPIVRGKGRLVHGWRSLWAGQEVVASVPPGVSMRLDLSDFVQREIYFTGAYEPAAVRFLQDHLKPGMCFLDIGANIGQFALIAAARVGAGGHVYAFEPSPPCYARLVENIRLNRSIHVTAENIALYNRCGEADFYVHEQDNWGMSSLAPFDANLRKQVVRLATLDEYVQRQRIARVDVMKLDVEGAELAVLQGAARTLAVRPPAHILCELNIATCRRFGYHPRDILTFLREYDYRAFHLDDARDPVEAIDDQGPNDHLDVVFVRGAGE